jgi:hypothetical protein
MTDSEPPDWNYWNFVISLLELLLQVMANR